MIAGFHAVKEEAAADASMVQVVNATIGADGVDTPGDRAMGQLHGAVFTDSWRHA